MGLTSLELCAGAGGQAVGLETAGFEHRALVENDPDCCETLRLNRPFWQVVEADIQNFKAGAHEGVDLLAGGLPCPPFSIAGKKLGAKDERNLFPAALRIIEQTKPRAVMIENVRGFLEAIFEDLLTLLLVANPWSQVGRRAAGHPQRLLERLLGRRTNALTNFFANLGIVLCHLQNGVVFL